MLWIQALTECTETGARATARFSIDHFAVVDGAVPAAALVECMAQTVAAAQGNRARVDDSAKAASRGMLASVSNFQVHARAAAEKVLQIEVREVKRFGPMLLVKGEISCEGERIASGDLTLYV
jgi:predicted hotdog family 3-hydroxylacyl-ACP dehydratase